MAFQRLLRPRLAATAPGGLRWAEPCRPSQRKLSRQQRCCNEHAGENKHENERAAAARPGKVGKSPDASQATEAPAVHKYTAKVEDQATDGLSVVEAPAVFGRVS